jgi:competence protein ComEA
MDAAPKPGAVAAPLASLTGKSPLVGPPDVVAVWPRCAQYAGVYLLGGLTMLLGVHAWGYMHTGAEPAQLDDTRPITYRVDLNDGKRAELMQLPGVGPALADRIEEYRRSHGGFRSVDELLKVPGIGPTTFERLRPLVTVTAVAKRADPADKVAKAPAAGKAAVDKAAALKEPIDVNHASLAELQKLPGIGPKLSQRIVDEREKKPFSAVNDLRRVPGIGPKTLEKIAPYVTVGDKAK